MEAPMTATFRISEDDYLAAMKLHARLTPARLALTVGIGLLLVLGAAFGPPLVEAASVGGLVGGGGVLLATRFIVLPLMARRHYRKYKAIHEEFNAELLDHGLRLTVPHSDHTIVWQNVLKWRHDLPPPALIGSGLIAAPADVAAVQLQDALHDHQAQPAAAARRRCASRS
jgi:hypothetical protein